VFVLGGRAADPAWMRRLLQPPSTILGANAAPAANIGARQQETLIALCNFAIVAEAAPLHHGRTR